MRFGGRSRFRLGLAVAGRPAASLERLRRPWRTPAARGRAARRRRTRRSKPSVSAGRAVKRRHREGRSRTVGVPPRATESATPTATDPECHRLTRFDAGRGPAGDMTHRTARSPGRRGRHGCIWCHRCVGFAEGHRRDRAGRSAEGITGPGRRSPKAPVGTGGALSEGAGIRGRRTVSRRHRCQCRRNTPSPPPPEVDPSRSPCRT